MMRTQTSPRTSPLRLVLCLSALVGAPACDDATSAATVDAAAVSDGALPDARALAPDALQVDQGAPPVRRGFGEPCEEDVECESGYCIEGLEAGRICTQFCGDCPQGYDCTLIGNTGADQTRICTVDQPDLCNPCETDRDCDDTEDLCLKIGNGHYCGEDCAVDGLCPEGYACADAFADDGVTMRGRQCVPANGEGCAPCRDGDGDGYGDGADCQGADCDDEDPTTYTGAIETCDGRDNNCNSRADELELLQVPVDLPACLSQGVCVGASNRCREGVWGCDYPVTYEGDRDGPDEPDGERTCDLLDNDCNGQVDESFELMVDSENCGLCGQVCAFDHATPFCLDGDCQLGGCEGGWNNADGNDGNGCEYLCVPTLGGIEICDALDNDCDNRVDEGFDGGEICDGADNDCDGQVDEDWDLQMSVEHCGRCNRTCQADHSRFGCEAGECVLGVCEVGWHDTNGDPADGCEYGCFESNDGVEACDRIDNDCDGAVDEETNLAGDLTHCGECGVQCEFLHASALCVSGECRIDTCDAGFADADLDSGTGCEYPCTPNNGGLEICNQIDDDCDTATDEGVDLLSDNANCGRCDNRCNLDNSISRCMDGACLISECLGGFQDFDGLSENGCEFGCFVSNDGVEACDNVDNDCDARTDEDFDLEADPTNCGFCGQACGRDHAAYLCDAGRCAFQGCEADFHDLNGVPDDGCEFACVLQNGGVEACDGVDDDCDSGTDEGLLNACGQCGRTPDEVCNGVDDNCNGQSDEGLLNACGLCGPTPEETCNFIDDNCNGQNDEGLRNRCDACGPEPGETCNGVDDDCDGLTDNHGVCGQYMENNCRWFVGWADENRGPGGVSNVWGRCPFESDKDYDGLSRCVGTRRDGLFMQLDFNGDVDDNDRLAFAFLCDDPGNPGLASYIDTHCAIYLGYSDNNGGPDGTPSWGACPPAVNSEANGLRCTSSGYDRNFRKMNMEGNVDGNDDFAVAFKCVDNADPGRAWSLQQSVSFYMGWGDVDRGSGDGSPSWGPCPGAASGEANFLRCTSTMGDGNFHRLDMNGNVNSDDDLGFALRARPAP